MHELDVGCAVSAALTALEEHEARHKLEMADLKVRFREERDLLRVDLRAALERAAADLRERLQLSEAAVATRLLLSYEAVPVGQIAAVFDLHPSKLIHLAEQNPQPSGIRCPRCGREHLAGHRDTVKRLVEWSHAKGLDGELLCCDRCWPTCGDCKGAFTYSRGVPELLRTIEGEAAGERFLCVGCSEKRKGVEAELKQQAELADAIATVEGLAGRAVPDELRELARRAWQTNRAAAQEAFLWILNDEQPSQPAQLTLFELFEERLRKSLPEEPREKRARRRRERQTNSGRVWDGSYDDYLESAEWRSRRAWALERAENRCQVCNSAKASLHVHHRTYERLGTEFPSDLVVLCEGCHDAFHRTGRLAR